MPDTIRDLTFRSHRIFPFLHRAALQTLIGMDGKNGKCYDKIYVSHLRDLGIKCHWVEEYLLLVDEIFPVFILASLFDSGYVNLHANMQIHNWRMGYVLFFGSNIHWKLILLSENELCKEGGI